jgi:hypothetical protein
VNAVEFIKEGTLKGHFISGSKDGIIAVWDVYKDS